MKRILTQILLWGFLVLQVCTKSTAQGYKFNYTCTSDFTVVAGGNKHEAKSQTPNFGATGTVASPLDGSSVFGTQMCAHGGGQFTGAGRLLLNSSLFEGQPAVDAAGETSVYILFELLETFHYEFASSVAAKGNVKGIVSFDGLDNIDGDVKRSSTIGPGQFFLLAEMVTSNGQTAGHGIWSYSLSLIPAKITSGKFLAGPKADYYALSSAANLLEKQLLNFADMASSAADRSALISAARSMFNLWNTLLQDFEDPLDTNYTALAQAVVPAVTPLVANGGITQPEADAYNSWLTNIARTDAYSTALTTSLNRAQGAAYDGNSFWESAQMNAAVQFEAQLAGLLDQEPALRSNLVAQFKSGAFQDITVTTNDALALQLEICTNGLPAVLLDGLTALGVDADTTTNIQYTLLTADPSATAGSFPASLANTNLDSAARTLAADLRDGSLKLINASLLPQGQFRFDLPTEPGYTYTIQFTENLAQPVAWTTLFTTNATTFLLSFTNTPAAGAQAGFYQASHN